MKRFFFFLFVLLGCCVVTSVGQENEDFYENIDEEFVDNLPERYFDLFASSPYEDDVVPTDSPDDDVPEGTLLPDVEPPVTTPAIPSQFLEYNLTAISARCPKDAFYSSYNPDHRRAVASLTDLFMDQSNLKDLLTFSEFSKKSPDIHPRVWYASFVRAQVIRTPDILELDRPSTIELFPSSFFPSTILQMNSSNEECALLDERFGMDNGIENRLWYFRENIQLNAHHWYWHLVNPSRTDSVIDRRGELFYYFHHELLARYNAERLANGLKPTVPLNFQPNTVLKEGYNPHLRDGISSIPWANRGPSRNISDNANPFFPQAIRDAKLYRDRVLDIIHQGGIIHDEGFTEVKDIDRVGLIADLTEASNRSLNARLYGVAGYHAIVHWIIANVDVENDPGVAGVIGDVGTALRDPVFYRWHDYIDVVFQAYKLTHLKPYTPTGGNLPLLYKGITVSDVVMIPENLHGENVLVNHLETFWNTRKFILEGGLDFNSQFRVVTPNVSICVKHLDHQEFYYRMAIENTRSRPVLATVRIFMAPRYKSAQQRRRYTMTEQRSLFFSMDSFQASLQPGRNILIRRSIDSTLTAGWPKSFQEVREQLRTGQRTRTVCDCGFPHHLLLPKGTKDGLIFDLFLMVTDGLIDQVENNLSDTERQQENNLKLNETCPPSYIHCGIPGRKYPDSRPMGYPFDRKPYQKPSLVRYSSGHQTIENRPVKNLEEFVKNIPNMHASQVVIYHRDEIFGSNTYKTVKPQ